MVQLLQNPRLNMSLIALSEVEAIYHFKQALDEFVEVSHFENDKIVSTYLIREFACNCPGFAYRKDCKHVMMLERKYVLDFLPIRMLKPFVSLIEEILGVEHPDLFEGDPLFKVNTLSFHVPFKDKNLLFKTLVLKFGAVKFVVYIERSR